MSQNDFTIANQTFPNTRTDINSALQALASTNSGSSAPSTTFASQLFYNTSSNLLQIRNEDNDAFITIAELDQTNDTVEYFKSDSVRTPLIEFTDGDDAMSIADGGLCTFPAKITADAGIDIDNINIDGTTIALSSGDLTLDAAGDIILDADGGDVKINDGGVAIAELTNSSTDFVIKSVTSDKDMIFKGNDGGAAITALTLDMSAAGAATFNNDVTAFSDERLKKNIETIPDALSKVCQMRGVTFNRTDFDGEKQMGVIAQEVEKIIPEVVKEDDSEEKIKSVAYGNMVGVLIEAIKELKAEVEELKRGK